MVAFNSKFGQLWNSIDYLVNVDSCFHFYTTNLKDTLGKKEPG